jgi:hypothetical protein
MVTCRSKRPGTQQGRVEDLGPVGRRQHDDPRGRVEAVHLRQQLIERLLAFVVGDDGARTGPALADGVDLVDEDDRRGPLARLGEQVAHPGRPHAHEHLDEARPADREERDLGLPGHRPGQQGLAGARRAHHQDAPGRHGAGPGVALGLLEEVDHLADLELGALIAGHVGKGRARALLVEDLGLGPPHPERPLQAARRSLGEPPPQVPQNDEGQEQDESGEHVGPETRPGRVRRDRDPVLLQLVEEGLPAWGGMAVV